MTAWEKYRIGIIPHIHIHDNPDQNIFEDALSYQGDRIKKNLEKAFPKKSFDEIMKLMFGEDHEI